MKDGIHPKYQDCVVTCGCGNSFQTRSTKPKIMVEVCSKCHPYFTGSVKFVDAAGRVDKFNKKFQGTYGKAKKEQAAASACRQRLSRDRAIARRPAGGRTQSAAGPLRCVCRARSGGSSLPRNTRSRKSQESPMTG